MHEIKLIGSHRKPVSLTCSYHNTSKYIRGRLAAVFPRQAPLTKTPLPPRWLPSCHLPGDGHSLAARGSQQHEGRGDAPILHVADSQAPPQLVASIRKGGEP